MLKNISIKNYKKIVSIILLIITMFSVIQPVLAASGSSNFPIFNMLAWSSCVKFFVIVVNIKVQEVF